MSDPYMGLLTQARDLIERLASGWRASEAEVKRLREKLIDTSKHEEQLEAHCAQLLGRLREANRCRSDLLRMDEGGGLPIPCNREAVSWLYRARVCRECESDLARTLERCEECWPIGPGATFEEEE